MSGFLRLLSVCRRIAATRQNHGVLMKSIIWLAAAPVLLAGLVTLPLPLPTGIPLLALGLVMVLAVSPWAMRLLRRIRRKSARLDGVLQTVEDKAPAGLGRILRRTRPRPKKAVP